MKKKLIIGLILVMLLVPVSCTKAPPVPAPAPSPPAPSTMPPPPVPATEGTLIEMHTKTTMAGVARHLTISVDGSIVFIEERGLRHPTKENPPTRTTRTGQLTEAELSNLLAMVDACLFDREGKRNARTEIIDTDAISELTVHYQKRTRIITANYQPLYHLSHPEIPELSDVHETVRKLYRELRYIIDSRTTQTAEEEITTAEVDQVLDIRVEPSPGTSLTKGIILDQAIVEVGSLDKPAFNPWNDRHYYVGDRCLLVLGDMRNDTDEDLYVDLWAEGFDSSERQVAWSISSGTMVGHVQLNMPQQSINSFEILLNWAEDVQLIKIIAHSYDRMIPSPPPPASSPGYPNHGITTTRATPEPGDNITRSSALMIKLTMDDLIEKSDAIAIGKVIDIFPSRKVDGEPMDINTDVVEPWDMITDVVIEVERYLYGQPRSSYIAVMVRGGRVGETVMWVEDAPVFNLGEEVALFLYRMQSDITPPEGFDRAEYYRVTGAMQGKLGYKDGNMVNLEGDPFAVSEIEQKIVTIHGAE
ncbi:hypothetical protein ES703_65085 [subsurface metagenome]